MNKGDWKEKGYLLKRRAIAFFSGLPYILCRVFPIKSNKIVFSAFEGMGYCCNPKYIAEELIRREKEQGIHYELVWLVNDMTKPFPPEITKAKYTLWNRAYHLSTAKIWVDNARKNYGTKKRKGQYYILTWHGPIGFKPVGRLRGESFSKIAEIVSVYDAKLVDVLLSNSEWCTNIWRTAFWNEPVMKTGSPRCDILFNHRDEQYRKIREKYGLPPKAKIIIYAPTFRGGSQGGKREVFQEMFSLDFAGLKESLEKRFGGEWYIFLRLHPQLTLRMQHANVQLEDWMRDISRREDLYEVLAGVDAFVSDYSSAAFDASYMRIPVFLYADDLDQYIADRGTLTWKLEDIPFPLAKNNTELADKIQNFRENEYLERLEKTFIEMGLLEDGRASERVVEQLAIPHLLC